MQDIFCLRECLRYQTDQKKEIYKAKDVKKWITLTKNNYQGKHLLASIFSQPYLKVT